MTINYNDSNKLIFTCNKRISGGFNFVIEIPEVQQKFVQKFPFCNKVKIWTWASKSFIYRKADKAYNEINLLENFTKCMTPTLLLHHASLIIPLLVDIIC